MSDDTTNKIWKCESCETINDVSLDNCRECGEDRPEDYEEPMGVSVIASGYEWDCPNCGTLNTECEYDEELTCENCGNKYQADTPDHSY